MRSTRAKALKAEARRRALSGKVASSTEYKKLKRSYNHPSYAPVVELHPTKPDIKFKGVNRKKRAAEKAISVHKLVMS